MKPQQPPIPPLLSKMFPKTSATMRSLTPSQTVAFVELLVKQLNSTTRLPLRANITKRGPYKLTIDVDITAPALEAPREETTP